jgi:hypothetical protein
VFIYIHILSYYKLFLSGCNVRKHIDVNEHERLSNITARKEQFVVRKDMDLNEHGGLSNITLRQKLK